MGKPTLAAAATRHPEIARIQNTVTNEDESSRDRRLQIQDEQEEVRFGEARLQGRGGAEAAAPLEAMAAGAVVRTAQLRMQPSAKGAPARRVTTGWTRSC